MAVSILPVVLAISIPMRRLRRGFFLFNFENKTPEINTKPKQFKKKLAWTNNLQISQTELYSSGHMCLTTTNNRCVLCLLVSPKRPFIKGLRFWLIFSRPLTPMISRQRGAIYYITDIRDKRIIIKTCSDNIVRDAHYSLRNKERPHFSRRVFVFNRQILHLPKKLCTWLCFRIFLLIIKLWEWFSLNAFKNILARHTPFKMI